MKKLMMSFIILFTFIGCKSNINPNINNIKEWHTVGSAGFVGNESDYISLALDNNENPFIFFTSKDDKYRISAMTYKNSSWVYASGNKGRGFSSDAVKDISISTANDIIYLSYVEGTGNGNRLMTRKFSKNNFSPIPIGAPNDDNRYASIAVDKNNIAYLSYINTAKILTVSKLQNNAFTPLINRPFGKETSGVSMIIKDGTPYIAAMNISYRLSVVKENAGNWEIVGDKDMPSEAIDNITFAVSENKDIYLAYEQSNPNNFNSITVLKNNKNSWDTVGIKDFAKTKSDSPNSIKNFLAIYKNTPYIAFKDGEASNMATVMKFDGVNWVVVGKRGFSDIGIDNINIAISKNGVIYVAYIDIRGKITVMSIDN